MRLAGDDPLDLGDRDKKPDAKPARRTAKPLTQPQLVNKLFKLAAGEHKPRSSVRLSTGPRGQVMFEVNIYAGDQPNLRTIAAAVIEARRIFDELRTEYPAPPLVD